MGKNLFFKYISRFLFSEHSPIYYKCCPIHSLRDRAALYLPPSVLLLLLVLILSCITGCIQNSKYAEAYLETPSAQEKVLKEPSSDGYMAQKDNASLDPRFRLELDFQPKVSRTLFSLSGNLVLWGNTTLPYLMLNATFWGKGLLVEKAKYMLIKVEPTKKYTFDILQNKRIAQGEYDCILEASSPSGSLFSEKRHCLTIDEPAEQSLQDRNLGAEEKSMLDISERSKIEVSEYEVHSQDGNVKENTAYDGSTASPSAEMASGISDNADIVKVSKPAKPAKNESVGSEDIVSRKVLLDRVSKNASIETNRISKPNKADINSNKGDSVVEGMFVGSTGSNKYHRPDCRFVDKIKNKIYFKSSEEARKNGKVPCKVCNPL
jgi:hypothetical protein